MNKIWSSILIVLAALGLATSTAHANGNITVAGQPTVVSSSATETLMGVLSVQSQYDHVGTFIAVPKSKIKTKSGTRTVKVKVKNAKGKIETVKVKVTVKPKTRTVKVKVKTKDGKTRTVKVTVKGSNKSEQLDCFWAEGDWINSMNKDSVNFVTYKETSRAKFCHLKKPVTRLGITFRHVKVAGGDSGKECYNYALPPVEEEKELPKPTITGTVMDYDQLDFELDYKLEGTATVKATATCVTGSSWASATAYGHGSFSTSVRVRVKSESKVKAKFKGSISIQEKDSVKVKAEGNAMLNLNVTATASCSGPNQKIIICEVGSEWNGERCAKSGATTPTKPIGNDAPGQNPPSHPDDPTKTPTNPDGSWKCFSETTGQPVAPLSDGRCPQGSTGGDGNSASLAGRV